ncbi:Transposon Tn10 TetC protein [Planctomycetes bacterium Pan216]|uniref:Transposon Tn10 TetC protein n=1 Tax=Kolteria novifilia TaxID=2527975 RepID=A0A518B154_9BACT|nr:Transposon Tn10 TetC protein [Planctomycetes bacterium Pan216]
MSEKRATKPSARQRILETAQRLFYAEGVRAVGIDRIIAEAGVAKMTLYNHFPSKDDLILAVLEQREVEVDAMFAEAIKRLVNKGRTKLEAFFLALEEWFHNDGFRGCSFINTLVELADREHPASRFSSAHKRRFHELLGQIIAEEHGTEVAQEVTPAIAILVEGAIITAQLEGSANPARVAARASRTMIDEVKRRSR